MEYGYHIYASIPDARANWATFPGIQYDWCRPLASCRLKHFLCDHYTYFATVRGLAGGPAAYAAVNWFCAFIKELNAVFVGNHTLNVSLRCAHNFRILINKSGQYFWSFIEDVVFWPVIFRTFSTFSSSVSSSAIFSNCLKFTYDLQYVYTLHLQSV